MKGLLQYKFIEGSGIVTDVDVKNRIITGYLSHFGTKDYDNDIIVKGAYKKSITERGDNIWFLNQHNWNQPHGKFKYLEEKADGLYFESNPMIEGVSYSDDTVKLYEAGVLNQHSVGFITVKSHYDDEEKARVLTELKLLEGSNVTIGANPNTPFSGFKSMTPQKANDQIKRIVKMLRNDSLTDETFELLEIALKQLQKDMFELGKKSLKDNEPSKDTQIVSEPSNDEVLNAIKNFKY